MAKGSFIISFYNIHKSYQTMFTFIRIIGHTWGRGRVCKPPWDTRFCPRHPCSNHSCIPHRKSLRNRRDTGRPQIRTRPQGIRCFGGWRSQALFFCKKENIFIFPLNSQAIQNTCLSTPFHKTNLKGRKTTQIRVHSKVTQHPALKSD